MISRALAFFWYDARQPLAAVALLSLVAAGCDRAALLAPTNSRISVVAASRVVPIGGTTQIEATVLENSGSPVPNGTTVRFTTNLGRLDPPEAQTRNGVAITTFHSGNESGVARVQALSGLATGTTSGSGDTATSSNVVEISVGAAAATRVSLSANPSTVRPSGSSVEVSAFVSDSSGNPVPNVPVTFSTNRGSITPTVANTDASGIARATLTSGETTTVTARVGSGADNRSATLEVRTSLTPSFTLATSPASPAAGQPVVLTITPAANTAPQVTVEWGDGASQQIGTVAAVRSVTHTYALPGFYTITATGAQDGDTFTNSAAVTVAQRPPVAVTVNPASGNTGTTFTFTITPTTGALIKNVTIDYDDGTSDNLGAIATQTTRQHRFPAAGTYTVEVTQTESDGTISIATVTVTVTA